MKSGTIRLIFLLITILKITHQRREWRSAFLDRTKEPKTTPIISIESQLKKALKQDMNISQSPLFPYKPKTGFINLYNQEGNDMFYWLFEAKETPETAPILIWLQGGPGCASTYGLFTENGPFYVEDFTKSGQGEKKADIRDIAWNQKANLLFPDQPLGVGFSTVTHDRVAKDQWGVKDQFLKFYEGFLEKNPQYKGRDVYISGESYGGHWVPYTAAALFNSKNPDIKLKGIAIGNGYINGPIMFSDYPSFSLKYKNYTGITEEQAKELEKQGELCMYQASSRRNPYFTYDFTEVCEGISDKVLQIASKFNPNFDPYYMPSDAKSNNSYYYFLNDKEVQDYLGVNKPFQSCNGTFGNEFAPRDFWIDSRIDIVHLLKGGVNVMVYDGDLDWICNYEQEELNLESMDWAHVEQWNKVELKECEYGLCKELENLKYVRFNGAGHMVPSFRPQVALDMINNELLMWQREEEHKKKRK